MAGPARIDLDALAQSVGAPQPPQRIDLDTVANSIYETKLSPDEEGKFQAWKAQNAPKDSGVDYDWRGAYKAGLKADPKSGHWPDTYKKPNHPTFSTESKYAKARPDLAGHWEGDKYVPPQKAAPSAPEQRQAPDQGVFGHYVTEPLVGAAEAATKLIGQTLIEFPAGVMTQLSSLGVAATEGPEAARRFAAEQQAAMHPYLVREPTTVSGKRLAAAAEKPLELAGKVAEPVVRRAAETTAAATEPLGPSISGPATIAAEAAMGTAVPMAILGTAAGAVRGVRRGLAARAEGVAAGKAAAAEPGVTLPGEVPEAAPPRVDLDDIARRQAPPPEAPAAPAAPPEAPPEVARTPEDLETSPEAIARVKAEKQAGITFFRHDVRTGKNTPIPSTVDRIDLEPGDHEIFFRRTADGKLQVESGKVGKRITPVDVARAYDRIRAEPKAPPAEKPKAKPKKAPPAPEPGVTPAQAEEFVKLALPSMRNMPELEKRFATQLAMSEGFRKDPATFREKMGRYLQQHGVARDEIADVMDRAGFAEAAAKPAEPAPKPEEPPKAAPKAKAEPPPMVRLHHGTTEDFTTFDSTRATDTGLGGKGFYFSTDPAAARAYGKKTVTVDVPTSRLANLADYEADPSMKTAPGGPDAELQRRGYAGTYNPKTGEYVLYNPNEFHKLAPAPAPPPAVPPESSAPAAPELPPAQKPALEPIAGPIGKPMRAYGPNNEAFDMRYRLVSLDDPLVNHKAVQHRQRGIRVASAKQVAKIAANLNPEMALEQTVTLDRGTPILGPDRIAESGNGRISGIRLARERHPERYQAFQDAQRAAAESFGFTPEQFDAIEHPLIVRERITDVPDRIAFAELANRSTTMDLAPTETAAMDARRIPPGAAARLVIGESQGLDQALQSPTNSEVRRQFLSGLDDNELSGIITADGTALTPAGLQRLKAAIVQQTFPGEGGQRLVRVLAESADSNIKNVETGIFGALGKLAQVTELVRSGARPAEMDVTGDLTQASEVLSRLRAQGTTVQEYLQQHTLGKRELDADQERLLELLGDARSAKQVRELLNRYADLVRNLPEPEQPTLGGVAPAPPATKAQLLLVASEGPQLSLVDAKPPPPKPEPPAGPSGAGAPGGGLGERGSLSPFAETEAEKKLRLEREQRAATETGDPLEDLTTQLKEQPAGDPAARLSYATRLAAKLTDARDAIGRGYYNMLAGAATLKDLYVRPPPWNNFIELLGKFTGQLQENNIRVRAFTKEIMKSVPDPLRREAIVNYIQAGGDMQLLQDRASKSRGSLKLGYEVAQQLKPEEIAHAQRIGRYFERRLKELQDLGLLKDGIEDYVKQVWERDSPFRRKLISELTGGQLHTTFDSLRHRVFGSYFEGEQAGYRPKNKDIGFLVAAYDQSMNRMLAGRGFVNGLRNGFAAPELDAKGNTIRRKIIVPSGDGKDIPALGPDGKPNRNVPPEAYLIRGYGPKDFEKYGDYRAIEHPALRGWTWATQDPNGAPIFVKGNVLVHPDHYQHLKNVLSTSWLRRHPVGRFILKPSMWAKDFRLAFSLFHPAQLAEHALFHLVNPASPDPIDIMNPFHREMVEHGLQVASYDGIEAFQEGVYGGGLLRRIPGIGSLHHKIGEWLFNDYIPRLKMALSTEAFERNTRRFPNWTRDQVLTLTANQANAAFGELNYKMIGRSPSRQDIFRLLLFAPDFLEARGRFVAQALRPGGKSAGLLHGGNEQRAALIRGAAAMYFAARIINKLTDDDYHWDRPFSVVHKGREYMLRTLPGDIFHLIDDWHSFVYHRENPATLRPGLELMTGRDGYGRARDLRGQLRDLMPVPIPFESLWDERDRGLWESLLQSVGIAEFKYRTSAERVAGAAAGRRMGDLTTTEREAMTQRRELREELRTGGAAAGRELMRRQLTGEVTPKQAQALRRQAMESDLVRQARHLPVADLLAVWDKASPTERRSLQPIIMRRLASMLPLADRLKLLPLVRPDLQTPAQ